MGDPIPLSFYQSENGIPTWNTGMTPYVSVSLFPSIKIMAGAVADAVSTQHDSLACISCTGSVGHSSQLPRPQSTALQGQGPRAQEVTLPWLRPQQPRAGDRPTKADKRLAPALSGAGSGVQFAPRAPCGISLRFC